MQIITGRQSHFNHVPFIRTTYLGPVRPTTHNSRDIFTRLPQLSPEILELGLEDVYSTLPLPLESRCLWWEVRLREPPADMAECYPYRLVIGHVEQRVITTFADVTSPAGRKRRAVTFGKNVECEVHVHFPQQQNHIRVYPSLTIELPLDGHKYHKVVGKLNDNASRYLLNHARLEQPFSSLSRIWSSPEVLPTWRAVLAWHFLGAPASTQVELETLSTFGKDYFISALRDIKHLRREAANAEEAEDGDGSETKVKFEHDGEESIEPKVKREPEGELKREPAVRVKREPEEDVKSESPGEVVIKKEEIDEEQG